MIVAYAGGGGHHFFVYPTGWVITFLVSTKGGSCVFAGSYRPPASGRNNERSLMIQNMSEFGVAKKA